MCFVLAAVLGTAAAGPWAPAGAQAPSLQSVADLGGRFTISVPSTWTIRKSAQRPSLSVLLRATQPGNTPTAPGMTVSVGGDPLDAPVSLSAYAARVEFFEKQVYHLYTIVQQGNTTVGSQPAFYRYFTWDERGYSWFQMDLLVTSTKYGFQVHGLTLNQPERIRQDTPLLTQILNSFRLTAP